jgi:hypothetical protein
VQRWTGSILILSVIVVIGVITGSFDGTHAKRASTVLSAQMSRVSYPDGLSPSSPELMPAPVPEPQTPPAPVSQPQVAVVTAPAPAPAVPKPDLSKPTIVNTSALGGQWACIRQKESSNNYQARSGPYYGAYQFDRSTWISNGGDPSTYGNASPAEQDRVAQTTQSRRGWAPWPATSRMCRLR